MCLLKVVFLVWFCVACTFRCFNTHFNAHMIRGMVLILTSDMVFDRGGIPSRKSKQHPYQIISSKRIKNRDPKHRIIISNSYKPVWRNVPKSAEDNSGLVLDSFTLSHPQKSLNFTVTGSVQGLVLAFLGQERHVLSSNLTQSPRCPSISQHRWGPKGARVAVTASRYHQCFELLSLSCIPKVPMSRAESESKKKYLHTPTAIESQTKTPAIHTKWLRQKMTLRLCSVKKASCHCCVDQCSCSPERSWKPRIVQGHLSLVTYHTTHSTSTKPRSPRPPPLKSGTSVLPIGRDN